MQTPFPTTRPFTSAALTGSADIHAIQAFYGSIASIDDALILIEAVRRRKAPRVHHRLTEDEQLAIGSGSIFVWNEEEAQIKRWTDGRHWSNSRMKGRFFMYKELAASKKTGTRRGRVAVAAFAAAAATSSSSKLVKGAQSASATSSPQGSTGKDAGSAEGDIHVGVSCAGPVRNDEPAATKVRPRAKLTKKRKPSPGVEDESSSDRLFLRKKTISVRTRKNERFHLVAYYFEHEEASLIRPSQVPQFAELPIEPGFYLTGLDATPLMVANPTAIPSSSNLPAGPATAAASVTRAFRPPSPISHGLLPEATYSRHDARHAAPTSRAMTIPTTYLAYGPQYQPMPPPRHPHSTTSAPASLAPPPPPSAAATAPYPQTWPPYPSSAVAAPYNPHAPFNYYTDGPSSHSAPADYYASGYSHTQSGWGYATGEPRDRDYPQYEPSRPTSYAPGANRALRTTDPPSAGAPSGSSDARANEALHSPTSAHSNSPGSWEHAPLHARVDSGSYSRYPTTSRRSVLAPTRNHNLPPPPSSASGYYYPPTPTSYGYGDPFGYHGPPPPPPPPSAGGSMSNGTGYPVYPAASAHSYSAYSEYRGGPAYLDPTVANTYYPQLPTPSSTRPIAMDVASSDSHVEEFVGQDK